MGTTKYSMSENLSSFDIAQWDVSHTFVWFIIYRDQIGKFTQRVLQSKEYQLLTQKKLQKWHGLHILANKTDFKWYQYYRSKSVLFT